MFCSLLQGGRRDGVMVGRKLLAKGVAVAKIDEVMIRHGLAHPLGEWSKSVIETSTEKSKAALERSYVVPVAGIQGVQATQVQVRYRPRTGQVVLRFPLPPSDCLPSTGRGASGRWKAPRPLEPAVWQPATARREPFANRKALPEKLAVQLMVRADGSVGSVCESIVYGYEPGDRSPNRRRLGIIADRRAAVLAEVETWRFEAAIVDGQPAATSYTLFVQLWPREEPKQSR